MRISKAAFTSIAVLAGLAVAVPAAASTPGRASPGKPAVPAAATAKPTLAYPHLNLPNGDWAQVYSDGIAEVYQRDGKSEIRRVPLFNPDTGSGTGPAGDGTAELPGKGLVISDLTNGSAQPYAPGEVVAIYRSAPSALTHALAALGVDHSRPLFTGAALGRMRSLRAAAQQHTGRALLDFPDAVLLHVTASSVPAAVAKLRANPDVAFAEPDWTVGTTDTTPAPVPAATLRAALNAAKATRSAPPARPADATGVPANYDLTSSAQSLLNAPATNAVAAYSELAQRYGQLPGQGEIITNVSLGSLDDASAVTNAQDPCHNIASAYGPTTVVMHGQRYLDWPSMPLIPTYTASSAGVLDPTGETCGDDRQLTEIGLDFSMMAPLPDQLQRPGETGSGLGDLLGIAPGASYRLVLPATPGGAVSDVDAAFLAAATQTPRPDVITASLAFGFDQYGFSGRFLEDDPMTQSVISSIVASGIVVCVSANDGLRQFTNAAVAPSGGAVATDVANSPGQATNLNDVGFSSVPSRDLDSGAIDVGGTTLNDIFAAPPDNPAYAALSSIQAFPATRYTGARNYSTGFGSRVNVSAPGDNVLSIQHPFGGGADAVQIVNEGGTSAAAPEVAAAAAVVLQTARLTHNDALVGNPLAVRSFLEQTGTAVPGVPQSDLPINIGTQVNVGHAVETLFDRAGVGVPPGVAGVAVAQRHQASALGGTISTQTDPANISLTGRLANAWLTIAPSWTGLPPNATFQLNGPHGQLASTPWARLQPSAILASAGLSLVSAQPQSVPLSYSELRGGKVIAQANVTLTFGPTNGALQSVQAPVVPSVVHGSVIPVRYDITGLTGASNPELVVSEPGRIDPATGLFFRPSYTAPLTSPTGTINVPVSALQGAGIYGVGIQSTPGGWFATNYSTYAFTRVAPTGDTQPAVPTLSVPGSPAGHSLEIGYHGSFQLNWDVTGVPGAGGAIAEFSAPGPAGAFFSYNTVNNPNGSERDANGHDTGSVAYVPLSGTHGTVTLNGGTLGLVPSMYHEVRVFATDRDGQVTGEASGVDLIQMDGVAASDGGSVVEGFGVNPSGNDGLITSNGGTSGSVETFNQATGATSTVVSSPDFYSTIGGGSSTAIFGHDVGVFDDQNATTRNDTFDVLNPASAGTAAGTWNPPDALGTVINVAPNNTNDSDAVLSYNSGLYVTPTDIAKGTFGTPVSIGSALSSIRVPLLGGFAEDAATGQAVVDMSDATNQNAPTDVVSVDLSSGKTSSMPGAVDGQTFGIAVNDSTGEVAEGGFNGIGLVNLTTHATTLVQPGGTTYRFPTAVPGTNDFLVAETASPDLFGQSPNNNSMSSVVLIDGNGNVLHRYEDFNFFNVFLSDMGDYLQVNPTTSTVWTLGPLGVQLHPFSYGS